MGKPTVVKAKTEKKDAEGKSLGSVNGEVSYDFGDHIDEAIKLFTKEVVFSQFVAQSIIDLQAVMRRTLLGGGDLKTVCAAWKPGVSAPRVSVDPIAAAKNKYAAMDPAAKAKFLAELKAMG
jgi:hypothetical protein